MEDPIEDIRLQAPGRRRFGRRRSWAALSIRTKLSLIIGLGFSVVFAAILVLQFASGVRIGRDLEARNGLLAAELLAGQMGQPLRFRDAGRISDIYAAATARDDTIVQITVLHADGSAVAQFARPGAETDTIGQDIETVIGAAPDGPVSRRLGDRFVAAVPVLLEDGVTRVGTLAAVWDHGPTVADIRRETGVGLVIGGAVALLGLVALGYLITLMVVRPIRALNAGMEAVARREFDTDIPGRSRGDEIGGMATRLAQFRDVLAREDAQRGAEAAAAALRQRLYARLSHQLAELAGGNIDCAIDLDEFDGLDTEQVRVCTHFNDVLHNLKDMLTTITATADSVRQNSLEISEVASDQSKRSEAQAATLEESAAAIEELNHSVQQTAAHAADAAGQIRQNREKAESGGEIVDRTVAAMKQIEASSQQINAITGVIEDIAFQTNLLALNAGVEAARAGEAGRGFAVVASEVRALAQRASDSANEIKELILTSGEHVTAGSALASQAGDALKEIIQGVSHVSDLVSQIATGSGEQARNLTEIKEGVSDLDTVTQQNAAVIEETSAASRTLSEEAERMAQALRRFRFTAAGPAGPADGVDDGSDLQDVAGDGGSRPTTGPAAPEAVFVSRAGTAAAAALAAEDGWDEF